MSTLRFISLTHERDDGGAEALPVPLLEEVLRGHRQHGVLGLHQLLDGVGEGRQVPAGQLERVDVCGGEARCDCPRGGGAEQTDDRGRVGLEGAETWCGRRAAQQKEGNGV